MNKEMNNQSLINSIFLSRFKLSINEIYSTEKYLTVIMRTSINERIFTKYFFQNNSKNFDLYPLLTNLQNNKDKLKLIQDRLNVNI